MSHQPQSHHAQAGQVSVCSRCGKELGFLDRLGPAKKTYRCRDCHNQVQQSLQRFRQRFLEVTVSTGLSSTQWHELQMLASHERLDMPEVLAFIQADALALVERIVAFAVARNELSPGTEQHIFYLHATLVLPNEAMQSFYQRLASLKQRINVQQFYRAVAQIEAYADITVEAVHYIQQLQETLAIPSDKAQQGLQRVTYAKQISDIRKGKFLTIRTSVQLESDELCHLETPATYHKVNAKSTTIVPGRFVVTNKKLHFLSTTRGMTINWSNIMRVQVRSDGVFLELSKGTGNGLYAVTDPILVGAVLDTLVKISKRQLVVTTTDPSRHIPQDVKNAVWQRDGGKCVQCGATSYLEFDHIIPHNKGGANTVANVQLLCRNCNLKKSDRI